MARVMQPYKNTAAHRQRTLSTESQFTSGMKYTHAPLGDGYARTLVNFKLHNDGETLTPRGGLTTLRELDSLDAGYDANASVYWTGNIFVGWQGHEDTIMHATLSGNYDADGLIASTLVVNVTMPDGTSKRAQYDGASGNKLILGNPTASVHGMDCIQTNARRPIATELNGKLYIMSSTLGLCYLTLYIDASGTLTISLTSVTPKEVTPALTINYGYNMLKTFPYSFSNTVTATGALTAHGVVPYTNDATPQLLLNARPGQEIVFKLVYSYPQYDVTNSETYRVQWELQDNDAGTTAEVIQRYDASPVYTPGSDIQLVCTPTVKNFSLIVRMYKTSDITDQEDEWDNNANLQSLCKKEDFVTPECVTTLASYSLLDDSASTARNLNAVTYSLNTATGICSWNQRIVLWGVSNARSMIWMSELNDPAYFPYPNNVELFDEEVIACIPYMTDLLVFTQSSIYKVTLGEDGLTFTTKRVQDKLNMRSDDINSVIAVQNMVFFRSGNYYYMVVPNYSYNTGTYGVQMAPISRPVEQLFDQFENNSLEIINTVLGLSPDLVHYPLQEVLNWTTTYVDGNEIHNVFNITVQQKTTSANTYVSLCTVNFHVVYDSVLRAWFIELEEADKYPMTVYKNTATNDTQFVKVRNDVSTTPGSLGLLVIYNYNDDDLNDYMALSGAAYSSGKPTVTRTHNNRQYLDTGNRDFAEDLKKRFREIQFCVNILERGQLKFNTGFIVDDTPEVLPYKWNVEVIDPLTGTLGVSREMLDELETPDHTALDTWELDTDKLPDTTMYKIRYHVCGKGYNGSAQILSDNQIPYELLHIGFVYRQMFAR